MVLLRTLYTFLLITVLTLPVSGVALAALIGAQEGARLPEANRGHSLPREIIPAAARPFPVLTFQGGGGALDRAHRASDWNAVAVAVPFEEFPVEASSVERGAAR